MDNGNFYSLDKLVEFGLSMAVANQMIGMMNQSMRSMYVPGSVMSMPTPDPMPQNIYAIVNGMRVGPLSGTDFNTMVLNRQINKDTLAWLPGMSDWQPVQNVPQLLKIIALTPPPMP